MGRIHVTLVALALTSASAVACGHDAGPGPYGAIGAPCRSDYDCGGLYCVSVNGGTCQVACRNDAECGPGWHCSGRSRRGVNGSVDVCVQN